MWFRHFPLSSCGILTDCNFVRILSASHVPIALSWNTLRCCPLDLYVRCSQMLHKDFHNNVFYSSSHTAASCGRHLSMPGCIDPFVREFVSREVRHSHHKYSTPGISRAISHSMRRRRFLPTLPGFRRLQIAGCRRLPELSVHISGRYSVILCIRRSVLPSQGGQKALQLFTAERVAPLSSL